MMFRKEEGLTLVELLVVIALVGVVASIAFPVISNVIAGAQTDATAASAEAVANFTKEYANFNLAQVGGDIVASTDGGDEIARIAGTL
jgi:prepilin-type N-terminal cleavage/methylation domain-containing protein